MAPELPGFIFDPVKKKYFRVTNGDQRYNSGYTNNSVRANKRRQRSNNPQNIGVSQGAELLKYFPSDYSDLLVNVKLGLSCIPSGWPLLLGLQQCTHISTILDKKAWLLEDGIWLLRIEDNQLVKDNFQDYLDGSLATHRAVGHVSRMDAIEFVSYVHGLTSIVYKDSEEIGAAMVLENQTALHSVSRTSGGHDRSPFNACLCEEGLIVAKGGKLLLKEPSGSVRPWNRVTNNQTTVDHMCYLNGVLAMAGAKKVNIFRKGNRYSHSLRVENHVHRVFLDEVGVYPSYRNSKRDGASSSHHSSHEMPHLAHLRYMRLTVVTTNSIYFYVLDLLQPRSKVKEQFTISESECMKLQVSNFNNADPIVLKMGDQLLIEVHEEQFTWIDLQTQRKKNVALPCFTNARKDRSGWSRSRLLIFNNRYFIQAEGIYELT